MIIKTTIHTTGKKKEEEYEQELMISIMKGEKQWKSCEHIFMTFENNLVVFFVFFSIIC